MIFNRQRMQGTASGDDSAWAIRPRMRQSGLHRSRSLDWQWTRDWLHKATREIAKHWRNKRERCQSAERLSHMVRQQTA